MYIYIAMALQAGLTNVGISYINCRGETWRNCPVNVVLWNTVQLLFPAEIEARKEALRAGNKKDDEEPRRATGSTAAVITSGQQHGGTSSDAGTATANWRSARPPAAGEEEAVVLRVEATAGDYRPLRQECLPLICRSSAMRPVLLYPRPN